MRPEVGIGLELKWISPMIKIGYALNDISDIHNINIYNGINYWTGIKLNLGKNSQFH